MKQHLAQIALVVKDYDEAILFYTRKLYFEVIEDTPLSPQKRWVVIRPPGGESACILLAKAANDRQQLAIGNQCGGRVFLFLYTDNFQRDFQNLQDQGIEIIRPPQKHDYGQVAVFADLYGNLWDLIEPNTEKQSLMHVQ